MQGPVKTYDEWKALGFQVQRGEKAAGRDKHGKALFSEQQVALPRRGYLWDFASARYADHQYDYDYEHQDEMAEAMGYDHMDFGD